MTLQDELESDDPARQCMALMQVSDVKKPCAGWSHLHPEPAWPSYKTPTAAVAPSSP